MKVTIAASAALTATAAVILASGALAGPGTGTGTAASHVDAPSLILDRQMDGSDLYAFVCPDAPDLVCLITNYAPAQQFEGTPFATEARYEVHVDQRGTGTPDLTYRWTFGAAQGTQGQPYRLEEIRRGQQPRTLVPDGVAPLSRLSGPAQREQAVAALPGGGRTLAAKAADSFYSNFRVVGMALTGNPFIPPIDLIQALDGNVNAMVLQVPKKDLALGGDPVRNPVVGIWATAGRKSLAGDRYPQMSRLGSPAMDVMTFFSMGEKLNSMAPTEDRRNTRLTGFIRRPLAPSLIKLQNWTFRVPPAPRDDLWQVYFTGIAKSTGPIATDLNAHVLNKDVDPAAVIPCDELRLNLSIPPTGEPNRFGLVGGDPQGYPNGRRLGDDIHGTLLRMLLGEPAGPGAPSLFPRPDNVTAPKAPVTSVFPYIAVPDRL